MTTRSNPFNPATRIFFVVPAGGGRVSSGVYFYRLNTPEGEFTRKMTLVE